MPWKLWLDLKSNSFLILPPPPHYCITWLHLISIYIVSFKRIKNQQAMLSCGGYKCDQDFQKCLVIMGASDLGFPSLTGTWFSQRWAWALWKSCNVKIFPIGCPKPEPIKVSSHFWKSRKTVFSLSNVPAMDVYPDKPQIQDKIPSKF